MKKVVSLILCIGLLCLLAVPASASTGNERLLEYDHIDTVTANLTLDRFWGIATCDGYVEATESNPVFIEVSLQQKTENGWETLETWTSEGQTRAGVSGRYAVARGYTYRTYTVGFVYDDNGTIIDAADAVYGVNFD